MQRLKTRPQFQATMAGGTIARTAHFALHRLPLGATTATQTLFGRQPDIWIGPLVPKRWARRAVTRNTIRRQIYAVSMRFETHLLPAAYVVRLRVAFDRKQFVSATSDALKRAVRAELEVLFFATATPQATP